MYHYFDYFFKYLLKSCCFFGFSYSGSIFFSTASYYRWPTYQISGQFPSNEQVHGLLFLCFHLFFYIHSFISYSGNAITRTLYIYKFIVLGTLLLAYPWTKYICTIHPWTDSILHFFIFFSFHISTIWTIDQTCTVHSQTHTLAAVRSNLWWKMRE